MADINEILLRITGDDDEGQRVLAAILAGLEALDDADAEPEVNLQGEGDALSGIGKIAAALQGLSADEANPEIDVDTAAATGKIALIAASLAALPSEVNVEVDVNRGGGATKGISILSTALGVLSGAGASAAESLKGVGFSIGPFAASLNPVTIAVALLAASIGVALVSALLALASSLAIAVAAVGALAVGLAAAFAPIAAIGIPAILALAKVMSILKREETEAGNAAAEHARQEQTAAQFARAHADAEREVAAAVAARRDAVVRAMREMEDAIEGVSDAYRTLERAQLSQEAAQLGIERAELNLKNFRTQVGLISSDLDGLFKKFTDVDFQGNTDQIIGDLEGLTGMDLDTDRELELKELVLAVKEARLSEKEATDGVSDSETALARARQDASAFAEKGIAASSAYAAAQDRLATAQRNLTRVEQDRRAQVKQENLSLSISQTKALSDEEKSLLDVTKELIAAFQDAFGPAVKAFIEGIVSGLKQFAPSIRRFRGELTKLGSVMGKTVGTFFAQLASPAMGDMFSVWIQAATTLAPLVGSIFTSLLDLLSKIGTAALPFVVLGFQAIAQWLQQLDQNTSVQDLFDIFVQMMPHLVTWLKVFRDIGEALFEVIVAMAPQGQAFAEWIAKAARELAKWAGSEEGRQQIKSFLQDAVPAAIEFVKGVIAIVKVLGRMSQGIIDAVKFLIKIWNAVDRFLQKLEEAVGVIDSWINGAAAALVRFFSGLGLAILNAAGDVATKAFELGKAIVQGMINGINSLKDKLGNTVKDIATAPIGLANKILGNDSPSKVFHEIGANVTKGFEEGIMAQASKLNRATRLSFNTPIPAGGTVAQGYTIQEQNVILPAAPGHDQLGDPRVQAELFAREMARRGNIEVGAPA